MMVSALVLLAVFECLRPEPGVSSLGICTPLLTDKRALSPSLQRNEDPQLKRRVIGRLGCNARARAADARWCGGVSGC